MGGMESVEDLVCAGKLDVVSIPTLDAFGAATSKLMEQKGDGHFVITDTLTSLAETARGDFKLGIDCDDDLWAKRHVFFAGKDPEGWTGYDAAAKLIMRRLLNLRGKGYYVITICHENDQKDPTTQETARGPQLNKQFAQMLIARSTDVFRLSKLFADVADREGNVKYKAGTRVLYLQPDDEWITKYHTTREVADTLPKGIVDPSMKKLCDTLHKVPGFLTLYGPPGIGKTSLACSAALMKE
jgi:hypothetical protein